LEHGELLGLLRNFWNRLDSAGAGANDGDPLASEVDTALREPACMAAFALEFLQAFKPRQVRIRQRANRRD